MRELCDCPFGKKIEGILCLNAPVLTGLKPSAIINAEHSEYMELRRLFQGSSLRLLPLYKGRRVSLMLYREERLRGLLYSTELREKLCSIFRGYEGLELSGVLRLFRARFQSYKETRLDFPHELGLLLGYPVRDVEEYIRSRGEGAVLTGYWKVYYDLPEALKTFQAYDVSIQSFRLMLSHGIPVQKLLEIYAERVMQAA